MNSHQRRRLAELMITREEVPREHPLRNIREAVNFSHMLRFLESLSSEGGKLSADLVVLFKVVLLERYYGFPSLLRTWKEAERNRLFRWFLEFEDGDELPDFTTLCIHAKKWLPKDTVESMFRCMLWQAACAGLLPPETVYWEHPHIDGDIKQAVPQAARRYCEHLFTEIDRHLDLLDMHL